MRYLFYSNSEHGMGLYHILVLAVSWARALRDQHSEFAFAKGAGNELGWAPSVPVRTPPPALSLTLAGAVSQLQLLSSQIFLLLLWRATGRNFSLILIWLWQNSSGHPSNWDTFYISDWTLKRTLLKSSSSATGNLLESQENATFLCQGFSGAD